jgi:hypothetical protein
MNHATKLGLIALTAALLLGSQAGSPVKAAEEHAHIGRPGTRVMDGRGQVLDSRYNHGYYYPALGASVRVLPHGYRPRSTGDKNPQRQRRMKLGDIDMRCRQRARLRARRS